MQRSPVSWSLVLGACVSLSSACDDGAEADLTIDLDASVDADSDTNTSMDASRVRPALDAARASYRSLIEVEDFRRYDAGLDPLSSHQPSSIRCPPNAVFVELGGLEVDTRRCNYVLSYTPARERVPLGATVRVSLLHFDLYAAEPAQAHLALLFGDTLQWEDNIPIPSSAGAVSASFTSTVTLEVGEPIRLHLHNHGGNTYLLEALELLEEN